MTSMPLLLISIVTYGVPALVGVALALWVFKREFNGYLAGSLAGPIAVWLALALITGGRSASSFLLGPPTLGVIIAVLVVFYALAQRWGPASTWIAGVATVCVSLVAAICVFYFFPSLPE